MQEVLIHTGQHYDREMSQAFFDQLGIPAPDRHLGIGSSSHGRMTGRIPIAHVEAGLRSFDPGMPEEVNRRLTDHVSRLLFCPAAAAVRNLRAEGIRRGVHRVGDVMMDALVGNLRHAGRLPPTSERPAPGTYYLATLHRAENVDEPSRLASIVGALARLPHPVLLPLHPRTRLRLKRMGTHAGGALRLLPPVTYREMLMLQSGARAIFTDSGGVQKEAFILGTPCVTLRERTEWVETLRRGANRLVGADPDRILAVARAIERRRPRWRAGRLYGRGQASEAIAAVVARFLGA